MKVLALLLLALALAFGQNQHIDTTVVGLAEEIDATSEHFYVSIDRIEDEIDVNGILLAERDIHVALRFDIVEDQQVSLNGVPVAYGYSELQVEAQIVEIDAEGQKSPFEDLVAVDIRIFVGTRMLQLEDGTPVLGVYIQERVVGIQTKEVWQATVKEQVFIVRKDGTVARLEVVEIEVLEGEVVDTPKEIEEEKPKHGHHGHHGHHGQHNNANDQPLETTEESEQPETSSNHHKKCNVKRMWRQFKHWFSAQTFTMRLLVSFGMGILLGCVCFAVLKVIRCCCCGKKCQKKCGAAASQEEAFKKNIHLYSLQYTAVPQDEKEEKKVQETA